MSKEITAQGQYTVKDSGEVVSYDFTYTAFESIQDVIDAKGEAWALSLVQRQHKVDENNLTREKTRNKNGHSTRATMTEEQKAEAKSERAELKSIASVLKAKGLTLADIENM